MEILVLLSKDLKTRKMKSIKNYITLSILCLFAASCQSQKAINKIKNCTNEKANNIVYLINPSINVDFYELTNDMEQVLLKQDILNDRTEESYEQLLESLKKDIYNSADKAEQLKGDFDKILAQHNVSNISGEINNFIFRCFDEVIEEDTSDDYRESLTQQRDRANYIFANSGLYYENRMILELIHIIPRDDFKEKVFRAPIILMIYENLQYYSKKS